MRLAAGPALVRLGTAVANFVLPHRCAVCRVVLGGERGLCHSCWADMTFITPPVCSCCGRPRRADDEVGSAADLDPCLECRQGHHGLRRTRAALAYDDMSRRMVVAFKHHGRLSLRPLFVRWLERAAAELLAEVDLIAPVPLHRWRLLHRGFNQSALLAEGLATAVSREPGPRYVPDLLLRHRPTRSQQGLGAAARAGNITAAAFRPHPRHAATIRGARVLLVDDVFTTGATLQACARVLDRAGAAAVDALCLARVTRPVRAPI